MIKLTIDGDEGTEELVCERVEFYDDEVVMMTGGEVVGCVKLRDVVSACGVEGEA